MLLLSDDVFSYAKKKYAKYRITIFILSACIYNISVKLDRQGKQIDNLTKEIEALKMKGD